MRFSTLALLGCVAMSEAWLPSQRSLFSGSVHNSIAAGKGRTVRRWLPGSGKIRGVNLGSLFIVEPWMASDEWSTMGCGDAKSEFDCVMKLGQERANSAFQQHWERWITEEDFSDMQSYGLNTVRIPIGYWMNEGLVDSASEHFPQGGLKYLERVCGWASDRGFYVILDLHGAPGAQSPQQPFTGQYAPTAGFYETYQYKRAYKFLQWITNIVHTNDAYRSVGMLEVVNEPEDGHDSLTSEYYPTAYSKIRATEKKMGVAGDKALHIQFMNELWGAGDPKSNLPDTTNVAFDNHRYLKWDTSIDVSQESYIKTSCSDDVASDGDTPVIVGEWSLSVADDAEQSPDFEVHSGVNNDFYRRWFAAQIRAYEKQLGWTFWSWKAELGDFRWSYKDAVKAGVIPRDLSHASNGTIC